MSNLFADKNETEGTRLASMKKRFIGSTLAATIVLSSAGAVALQGTAFASQQSQTFDSLYTLASGVKAHLSSDQYATVKAALTAARAADWGQILYSTPTTTLLSSSDALQHKEGLASQAIGAFILLPYTGNFDSETTSKSRLDSLLATLNNNQTNITNTNVSNFYESVLSSISTQDMANLKSLTFTGSRSDILINAVVQAAQLPANSDLVQAFQANGIDLTNSTQLTTIKNNLEQVINAGHPNLYQQAEVALVSAYISYKNSLLVVGGGGGGGALPPTTTPTTPAPTGVTGTPVDLSSKATVTSTKDSSGNVVTSATIDTATLTAALTDNTAKDFTFNVGDSTSEIVQATLPADAILKVAAANQDSSFTVQTPLGALNVPVKILNTVDASSLAKLFNVDPTKVDLSQVKVNVVVSKPQTSVNTAVSQAATQSGVTQLAPTVDFSIQVSLSGQTVELNNFQNQYVSRTLPLNSGVDATNAVGVRVHTDMMPDGSVKATFYPVPTVVSNGVVTLKRPGDSTYTVVSVNKTFNDVSKNWAKDTINLLASKLVLNGYSDGSFKPTQNITRAEFSAALVRALGLTADAPVSSFKDMKASDWASGYVTAAYNAGIVKGYGDSSFHPNQLITRGEAAVMVSNAAKFLSLQPTGNAKSFADQSAFQSWNQSAIQNASALGVLNGYPDNHFYPNKNASRDEVATMIYNIMKQAKLTN